MSIGEQIKKRRLELGYSQEELAEKMGYRSKTTINKIEMGKNDVPQRNIKKFAEILKTSIAYLMEWEEEKPTPAPTPKVPVIELTAEQEADLKYIIDNNRLFFKRNKVTEEDSQKLEQIIREFYIETLNKNEED